MGDDTARTGKKKKKKRKKRLERVRERETFISQRMSVGLAVVLTYATCGLFSPIWFMMRRRFFDSLDTSERIDALQPALALLCSLGSLATLLPALGERGDASGLAVISRLLSLVAGIVTILMAFRGKRILQQHLVRTHKHLAFSGAATFFFNAWYLQYKINQAADLSIDDPIDRDAFD